MAQASAGPWRLIVSFFAGDSPEEHQAVFTKLRKERGITDAIFISASEQRPNPRTVPFADLRLSGEALGLVWVEPRKLPETVEWLREKGAVSIYLLSDQLRASLS